MRSVLKAIFCCLLLFFPFATCLADDVADNAIIGRASWIYDGDTIEVEHVGRVRLLGIDTPEHDASHRDRFYQRRFRIPPALLRQTAHQATAFVTQHAHNRLVRLEFDQDKTDRYGRTLAYVYLPDGRLLNLMLLEEGLAAVFRNAEFKYKKRFFVAERKAQKQQLGLWQQQNR